MLPSVALLVVFDFYVHEGLMEEWCTLVHVCQKWRSVAFGSACHLNLQLLCTASTPVRETLDVWPLLPIVVWGNGHEKWGVDNIVAALEHNDRICQLDLIDVPNSQLKVILTAMQRPFPELTWLGIQPEEDTAPVFPASLLGGSAPRLQGLTLHCIPFPGLPNLLLSATDLVRLELLNIPHLEYIPPEAMVTCLSALTRLEILSIEFISSLYPPDHDNRHSPPPTRNLLPVLTQLQFQGSVRYLEDLVAPINSSLLYKITITFFDPLVFNTPQLTRLISRTPKFETQ
jgi:hypothetical protein